MCDFSFALNIIYMTYLDVDVSSFTLSSLLF